MLDALAPVGHQRPQVEALLGEVEPADGGAGVADRVEDAEEEVGVVEHAVAVGEQRPHLAVERADEVGGVRLVAEPRVDVLREQLRALREHAPVVVARDAGLLRELVVRDAGERVARGAGDAAVLDGDGDASVRRRRRKRSARCGTM